MISRDITYHKVDLATTHDVVQECVLCHDLGQEKAMSVHLPRIHFLKKVTWATTGLTSNSSIDANSMALLLPCKSWHWSHQSSCNSSSSSACQGGHSQTPPGDTNMKSNNVEYQSSSITPFIHYKHTLGEKHFISSYHIIHIHILKKNIYK